MERLVALLAEMEHVVLGGSGGGGSRGRGRRVIVAARVLEIHDVPEVVLDLGLVAVYLGDVGRQVVLRRAGLEAVATGDVLVALVHAIDVLPEVRGAAVTLVAEIAGEEIVYHAPVVAEIVEARELEVAAHLAAEVADASRLDRLGEAVVQLHGHWETWRGEIRWL